MGISGSRGVELTPKELEMVQNSWKVVMQNPEENGVVILKLFLEKYNYYSAFQKFKGIPVVELPENKVFRSHALSIITTIDEITANINNIENLKILLIKLGRTHKARRITSEQFIELKEVILEVLEKALGLQSECLIAWNKTFEIAFTFVFQGLQNE